MAKKIRVKPIEKIQLEFVDGTTKDIVFSAAAVAILDEEFDGVLNLVKNVSSKPYEIGSKIIYAGMKVCDENVTLDDVKALSTQLPFEVIMELIEEFTNSFGIESMAYAKEIEELKKTLIKEMLQK